MYFLKKLLILCIATSTAFSAFAQEDDKSLMIGVFGGIISYQGDLQPNSFSFSQSKGMVSIWARQPITNKFSVKAGISHGKINAADRFNRDYLKVRNLSFFSNLTDAFLTLDYQLIDLSKMRFSPYAFGGLVGFHFNPYTFDQSGTKVYLQPLGTEGQGIAGYPDRTLYKKTQLALTFGGGFRFAVNENININLEATQRKTFTDYLDDVSKSYVDEQKLLLARGPKAVELAYRGDELPNGSAYPKDGEQRGTPTEMDWYYFTGVSVEIKTAALSNLFNGGGGRKKDWYNTRCPKIYY